MPIRAILFDFDGTLADSFRAIASSTNYVRASYGLPPLSYDTIKKSVGYGLHQLMAELIPGVSVSDAIERYRQHHEIHMLGETQLMPGVRPMLSLLRKHGFRMAVCSNKQSIFTKRLVAHLDIADDFDAVLGPDSVGGVPKPDPKMLLEAMKILNVSVTETLYVGDMVIDVQVARAAGVPVWLVAGGAARLEDLQAAQPERLLPEFSHLAELISEDHQV